MSNKVKINRNITDYAIVKSLMSDLNSIEDKLYEEQYALENRKLARIFEQIREDIETHYMELNDFVHDNYEMECK